MLKSIGFLKFYFDINEVLFFKFHDPPVTCALENNLPNIAELLIEKGADIHVTDKVDH